jgi:hypothetical protein
VFSPLLFAVAVTHPLPFQTIISTEADHGLIVNSPHIITQPLPIPSASKK